MSFSLFDLNVAQYQAATYIHGVLVILAGAGTGKTSVLMARMAWMISQNIHPENILAVTFTNKAAREMRSRIHQIIPATKANKITVSTFHALGVKLLRNYAHLIGYTENFSIFDEGDQLGLIKKIIAQVHSGNHTVDPKIVSHWISKLKNKGISELSEEHHEWSIFFNRYQNELKVLNCMDFDDLLLQTYYLLKNNPEVCHACQLEYQYILVDEFQDTSYLQIQLLYLLVDHQNPNLCVVGDDDQSIYSWRGAESLNFVALEKHFIGTKIIKLEQNYRSTDTILKVANRLIAHNTQRTKKTLWSDNKEGDAVRIIIARNEEQEVEFIADELQTLYTSTSNWNEFAILYRMNSQSRLFEHALRNRHIPYRVVGGKSFFDRREIKDIIAYLIVLINPENDNALLRVLVNPPRGIGPTTLKLALEIAGKQNIPLFKVLFDSSQLNLQTKKTKSAIEQFMEQFGTYRIKYQTLEMNLKTLLETIIEESGYLEYLKKICKTPEEAMNRAKNVNDLLTSFEKFLDNYPDRGINGFLDSLSLNKEWKSEKESVSSGVSLITMHAVKGLEFSHVWIIGAEEGIIPHEKSKIENNLQEERRLFYVGLTRAKKKLTISCPATRKKFGKVNVCIPSCFLDEINGYDVQRVTIDHLLSQSLSESEILDSFDQIRMLIRE